MGTQINLEEILNNQFEPNYDFKLHYGNTTTINILEAMKEAVKKALELAAENAKVEYEKTVWDVDVYIGTKQSMLDTINKAI